MMNFRIEKDKLGTLEIPAERYYGIHTQRALNNFRVSGIRVNPRLIKAMALVKAAAATTNKELGYIDELGEYIYKAAKEIAAGNLAEEFPLDAMQGGAGTSTNMNLNEVIANRALELAGRERGDYSFIDPVEHVNLHQSTNDVYPTALKISLIYAVRELSHTIEKIQGALQAKEREFSDIITLGRTEMQDAVPITLGSQFAAMVEAFSRDRWRTFKCEERLRSVNIGGTAVGTGLTAPRKYIFLIIDKLRLETGLGLSRSEHIMGDTANIDSLVEVHGILAANAANLGKIAGDLRLLHFLREIELPALQAGSSIMPGKVNPVISETVMSAAMQIQANDMIVQQCAARGTLQINEFMPMAAHAMLQSVDMLINVNSILAGHIQGIIANPEVCKKHFEENPLIITAFLPYIGYNRCEELLEEHRHSDIRNFREFIENKLGKELTDKALSPQNLMSLGYR